MNKKKIGNRGEDLAANFLEKNGFTILNRNFRAGRFGEIDIIASENEYICFIEVKTRTGKLYGTPAEAVGYDKRMRLKKLAWMYMKQERLGERNMRFDIVEIIGRKTSSEEFVPDSIELLRSAF